MRKVLADVNPSGSSTFSLIHQALSGHSPSSAPLTAQALLVKMGHLPGIEECLRLFTAVEVLEGEAGISLCPWALQEVVEGWGCRRKR